jgi:hypothetical protein
LLLPTARSCAWSFDARTASTYGHRMMEYRALIKRRRRRPLRQVAVFVGSARVADHIAEDGQTFRYEAPNLRDLQAEELIKTGNPHRVYSRCGDRKAGEPRFVQHGSITSA